MPPPKKRVAKPQKHNAAVRARRASANADANTPAETPKKRGRPAKPDPEDEEAEEAAAPPKKRGRPPKAVTKAESDADDVNGPVVAPKKRGRPPKASKPAPTEDEEPDEEGASAPPKKRGRPSKATAAAKPAPAVPENEEPPPRRRGRPPKGGQTTKIAADDDAAADQLAVELEEAAAEPKVKANGKKAKVEEADDGRPKFWLMKAEQEDRFETAKDGSTINAKFTIDDLRSKDEPEPWDGVRNPVAANNMRAMRKGELAFFYASGGKAGRSPGITGIMEIVSEAEQDPTVSDEGAYGYVEKEADRKKWVIVKVEFRKKLSKPVTLKELQKFGQPSGVLEDMQLLKQSRLSVSKVTEEQWNFVVEKLIDGYDDGE